MERINAYVPEDVFFKGKDTRIGRTLHEDSAIVCPHDNFKIIAARGRLLKESTSLYEILDDTARARKLLCTSINEEDAPILVPTRHGTLLVFPQIFKSTGLILVVHVNEAEASIRSTLDKAFELSATPIQSTDEAEVTTQGILEEIFYYTNRIFSWNSSIDQRTLFRLIANFTGCNLTLSDVSFTSLSLKEGEKNRLIALLLTTLLGMHKYLGSTDASTHQPMNESAAEAREKDAIPAMTESPMLSLEITHSYHAQHHLPPRHRELIEGEQAMFLERLLSLPAFSHFYALEEDGRIILESNFPIEESLGTVVSRGTFKQIILTLCPLKLSS